MLTSLALIFLVGLAAASICQRIRLPRIIGMLATGILLGPYVLDFLDGSILSISSDLREMALVIILIKAGLSLDISELKEVGRPAVLMAFLPAVFEILAFVLLAPGILGVTLLEAAILGAVLGAVSPAVVVPKMVQLMETGYGTDKGIPQLILAGIPISILLGIAGGALTGWLLALFFESQYAKERYVRNSMKVIIVLGISFLLVALETWLEGTLPFSGLLAVMSMACVLQLKSETFVTRRLAEKFGKLWLAAEVILFVLVGAAVDIRYTLDAGLGAVLMIFLALALRSAGVLLCLLGTKLNRKERLFCVIAYLPKATVQAAIGSVPLALGLPCGKLVLSVAVLSILITAPLGAFGMDATYKRLLNRRSR